MMIKRIAAALAAVLAIAGLGSCKSGGMSDKDVFVTAATPFREIVPAYGKSVSSVLVKPSSGAGSNGAATYTYNTEDGPKTEEAPVTAFISGDGDISVTVGELTFTLGKTVSVNGSPVRSTDGGKLSDVIGKFISDFCRDADASRFESAPDSIRAADTDVEVTRYTLRLDRAEYLRAFDRALSGLDQNKEYLTDMLGLYAYLHDIDRDGEELLSQLISDIKAAVNDGGEQAVWQRYVRNGEKSPLTAACRLKVGDSVLRYLCAEGDTYTELELFVQIGDKKLELAYEKRSTGMSDSYNVRISEGDRITYFDGETETAYKSGGVSFELLATKGSATVNGLNVKTAFSGMPSLSYKGSGNFTRHGKRTEFSFDLSFTEDAGKPAEISGDAVSPAEALSALFGG